MSKASTAGKANQTPATLSAWEIIIASFGEFPRDVIAPIHTAAKVSNCLSTLFLVIKEEAEKSDPRNYRIQELAELGEYAAEYLHVQSCGIYDQMHSNLQEADLMSWRAK